MDEKKQNEPGTELDDELMDSVVGGLSFPYTSREDDTNDDPKPWLRPHKER